MIPKKWAAGIKAAITVAIIWLVISHVDLAPVAARLRHIEPFGIVIAMVPFVAQQVLWAERWRVVCGRLGVDLRFMPALQIVTIGMFFNQTLPSSVGGDAMRVWLLVRDRVSFGKALSTVLCDRVLALVVLVALSAATLPLFYEHIGDPHARYGVTAFVAIGTAGFAVFLAFGTQIAHLLGRWKVSRPFGGLARDFHLLFTNPTVTISLIAWSLAIHILTIVSAWVIARVLGIDASLFDCLVVIPPVLLVTMLPVSIAGWGVREGAMVVGFGLVGLHPSDALAISICFGLAYIIIGLPGGLLWLSSRQAAAARIAPARD